MHQNIERALMKTQSRAFRTSNWAEGSPSNWTMTPNHTARVAYRQLCECPWVAQPQPGLEYNQIFLEKPENVHLPHPTWQSLRREEMRRRMVDNFQIPMCKACRIIPQKTWGCKGASAKYWVKGMKTYAMYLFQFFFFFLLIHQYT